jgi:hypothetical protein
MASLITTKTDGMYVRPRGQVMCNSGPTTGPFVITDTVEAGPAAAGAVVSETADLTLTILPVETVATTETLATGLPGLLAVAWQGNDVSADGACPFVSDIATGTVTWSETEAGTVEGWLWCLHRG